MPRRSGGSRLVTKVTRIRKYGLFRNFRWGEDLDSLKRFNLIYGWNYSGKTTLSRIFRSIELQSIHEDFNDGEFELVDASGRQLTQHKLDESPFNIRVFNTDYVEENLHWDSQEAEPIFYVGKEDIELQKRINHLAKEIDELSTGTGDSRRSLKKSKKELEDLLTNKARELDRIKSPYDKKKLRKALERIESNPLEYFLTSEEEVLVCVETLKTSKKELLENVATMTLSESTIGKIRQALEMTPVSKAIARLENDPALNSWVQEGLVIHRGKDKCEFCGNRLPTNLLREYEQHFSKEYEDFIEKLNSLIDDLKRYEKLITLPDEKRLFPELEKDYLQHRERFRESCDVYNKGIEKLKGLLQEKLNHPFLDLKDRIVFPEPAPVKQTNKELNRILSKHNEKANNLEEEKTKAFGKLELHFASEFAKDYNYFTKLQNNRKLEDLVQEKDEEELKKRNELVDAKEQLSDTARAARKMNEFLQSVFNRSHIRIESKEKGKYRILRYGSAAKNLSSGEKTAIAFSHFLIKLGDTNTELPETIVFVDDPISSLDSNHMYNTFSLIRTHLCNCHQLIISTHNHDFFNLIKEWLRNKDFKEKSSFYLIERSFCNGTGTEEGIISNLPSTLLKYRSEYHFLYSRIRLFSDAQQTDYNSLYQIPNLVRRFLEAFLGFKYSQGINALHRIINNKSDCIKTQRLLHEFSHQKNLDRSLRLPDSAECKDVVHIVLEAVKNNDPVHYRTLEEVYKNTCSESED